MPTAELAITHDLSPSAFNDGEWEDLVADGKAALLPVEVGVDIEKRRLHRRIPNPKHRTLEISKPVVYDSCPQSCRRPCQINRVAGLKTVDAISGR
jgi:hypothetical protein